MWKHSNIIPAFLYLTFMCIMPSITSVFSHVIHWVIEVGRGELGTGRQASVHATPVLLLLVSIAVVIVRRARTVHDWRRRCWCWTRVRDCDNEQGDKLLPGISATTAFLHQHATAGRPCLFMRGVVFIFCADLLSEVCVYPASQRTTPYTPPIQITHALRWLI